MTFDPGRAQPSLTGAYVPDRQLVDAYGLRPRGVAVGRGELLRASLQPTQEYQAPLWARTLTMPMQTIGAAPSAQQRPSGRPGFPTRIQLPNIFTPGQANTSQLGSESGLEQFMAGDLGQQALTGLGAMAGEQRGGFYNGIATTPMTVANFATYGREGLMALLSSTFLGGAYQQQEGQEFGVDTQYQGPDDPGIIGGAVKGVIEGNKLVGNMSFGLLDLVQSAVRQHDANYRTQAIREVFAAGSTGRPVLPFEQGFISNISTLVFGGAERYTMEAIAAAAAARGGLDPVAVAAEMWDIPYEVAAQIARNPNMSDQQLDELATGLPFSVNAATNMVIEGGYGIALTMGGYMGAMRAVGAAGSALAGASRGGGFMGQLANAVRPTAGFASPTGIGGQLGRGMGYATRKALQLNALNTGAGWTVRGFEVGIKQIAGMAGNQELVDTMDRLLWEMPWSMNPGLNLIDGFSMRARETFRPLREAGNRRLVIGRQGTLSEAATIGPGRRVTLGARAQAPGRLEFGTGVGARIVSAVEREAARPTTPAGDLDVAALRATRTAAAPLDVEIAGKMTTLPASHPIARAVEVIRGLTLDDINDKLFKGLGFDRAWLESHFGPDNQFGLTLDDLRNFLVYGYGQVIRDRGFTPQNLPGATMVEKSNAFFRSEAPELLDALFSDLAGESRWLGRSMKGQWWELASLNDSSMAQMKGRLAEMYEPHVAFLNMAGWIRASKMAERAYREVGVEVVPTYARRFNRGYITDFRKHLNQTYKAGEVVSNHDVLMLRANAGPVEQIVSRLKQGRRKWTREQLLQALDVIERADDEARAAQTARAPRAAPDDWEPGVDPFADARILGVGVEDIVAIEQAIEQGPPAAPPSSSLLQHVATRRSQDAELLAREPARAWEEAIAWYTQEVDDLGRIAEQRKSLLAFGKAVQAHAAMDGADTEGALRSHRVSEALDRIVAQLVNRPRPRPLGRVRSAMQEPPDTITYADPEGLARWEEAAVRAGSVASDVQQSLDDPARHGDLIRPDEQTTWAALSTQTAIVNNLLRLIAYVRDDAGQHVVVSQADLDIILDPTTHPFLKAASLQRSDWSAVPRETQALAQALSVDGEDLARKLIGQVLGEVDEARDLRGQLIEATGKVVAHRMRMDELGNEVLNAADGFRTVYGRTSPEAVRIQGRMQRGGVERGRRLITRPIQSAGQVRRRALDEVGRRRAVLEAQLREVQARISEAPQRRGTELEFRQAVSRLDGKPLIFGTKKAAEKAARDLDLITPGLAHRVERIGGSRRYGVMEGRPAMGGEAPPAAGAGEPPPPDFTPGPGPEMMPVPEEPPVVPSEAVQAEPLGDTGAPRVDVSIRPEGIGAPEPAPLTDAERTVLENIDAARAPEAVPAPEAPVVPVRSIADMGPAARDLAIDADAAAIRGDAKEIGRGRGAITSALATGGITQAEHDALVSILDGAEGALRVITPELEAVPPGDLWKFMRRLIEDEYRAGPKGSEAKKAHKANVAVAERWSKLQAPGEPYVADDGWRFVDHEGQVRGPYKSEGQARGTIKGSVLPSYEGQLRHARREIARRFPGTRGLPNLDEWSYADGTWTNLAERTMADRAAPPTAAAVESRPAARAADPMLEALETVLNRSDVPNGNVIKWLKTRTPEDVGGTTWERLGPEGQAEIKAILAEKPKPEARAATANRAAQMRRGQSTPAPRAPVYGKESVFQSPMTETTRPITGRLRLMEADEIVDSWDEGYDQSLQPRRTDDPLREDMVQKIARAPDPRRMLGTPPNASEGVPVVTPEGMAFVGNHRVRGVKTATDEAYEPVRQELAARAAEFGLDPAEVLAMRRPVLVREIPPEYVTPEYARAFNEATGGMTDEATGIALARELDADDLAAMRPSAESTLDKVLDTAGASGFIRRIIEKVPERGRARLIAPAGLTPAGRRVMKVSLLTRVLGDGDAAVRILDTTSQERGAADNLARGILNSSSQLADAEMLISSGQRAGDLQIGPVLVEAHRLLEIADSAVRGAGNEADSLREALRVIGENATDVESEYLARALLTMKSGAEVTRFLDEYARALRSSADMQSEGMFAAVAPELSAAAPRYTYLNQAIRHVNETRSAEAARKAARTAKAAAEAEAEAPSMWSGADPIGLQIEEIELIPGPDRVVHHIARTADDEPAPVTERPIVTTPEAAVAAELEPSVAVLVRSLRDIDKVPEGTGIAFEHHSPAVRSAIVNSAGWTDEQMAAAVQAQYAYHGANGVEATFNRAVARLNAGEGDLSDLWLVRRMESSERYDAGGLIDSVARYGLVGSRDVGVLSGLHLWERVRRINRLHAPDDPVGTEISGAMLEPDTILAGSEPRVVDPDFEARSGVTPDTQPHLDAAQADLDSGKRTIVPPGDEVTQKAAQTATGLPRRAHDGMTNINEYDEAAYLQHLEARQGALDAELRHEESVEADIRNRPAPPEGEQELDLPPDIKALWDLYMADELAAADVRFGTAGPQTIGEVLRAIESLDFGFPPRLPMPDQDMSMAKLREGLVTFLEGKLDEWGVEPRSADEGLGPTVPGVRSTPTTHHEMLEALAIELQSKVYVTNEPLEGYLGTAYEFIPPPTRADGTRLFYSSDLTSELQRFEDRVPGLGDELAHGREQSWETRSQAANDHYAAQQIASPGFLGTLRRMYDIAAGPRPQRNIEGEAFARFAEDMLDLPPEQMARILADPEMYEAYADQFGLLRGLVRYWHDHMREERFGPSPFRPFRKVGLVNPGKLEQWTTDYLQTQGEGGQALLTVIDSRRAAGVRNPTWSAWRKADNRIRGWFAERPGGVADFVERIYQGAGQASERMAGVTVLYHAWRFLMDVRWLAMEFVEMPVLVASKEGPGALMEAVRLQRGAEPGLLFTQGNPLEKMMDDWAWWAAESASGGYMRWRENGVMAIAKRNGERGMVEELERMARADPRLAALVRANGDTPKSYLQKLDRDFRIMATRGQKLEEPQMRQLLQSYLDEGTITPNELEKMVADGRWVGHPGLESAIAHADDPVTRALLRRLNVISEQAWSDASQLIFGQADRSNVQRLLNHPLLYWPISYQIKATRWLAGFLTDRAFGVEMGAGPLVTLGSIHEAHKDLIANDPEAQQFFKDNETLLFVAQMLIPITPMDIGVSLSPFTRLAYSMMFGTDVGAQEPYRRNILAVGSGYSAFELYPRLLAEQAEGEGLGAELAGRASMAFPRTIQVKPSTSTLAQQQRSQLDAYGGVLSDVQPQEPARYVGP